MDSLARAAADGGAELMPESWEFLEIWSADGGIYCCTGPLGGLWNEYGTEDMGEEALGVGEGERRGASCLYTCSCHMHVTWPQPTSSITKQICFMQSEIADRQPEIVTTRSLELGRASPDT